MANRLWFSGNGFFLLDGYYLHANVTSTQQAAEFSFYEIAAGAKGCWLINLTLSADRTLELAMSAATKIDGAVDNAVTLAQMGAGTPDTALKEGTATTNPFANCMSMYSGRYEWMPIWVPQSFFFQIGDDTANAAAFTASMLIVEPN